MEWRLDGKIAILSGAGGNLGPVWREALEEAGARVYGIDLPAYDITNIDDLARFRNVLIRNGCIPDIIINNAALDHPPQEGIDFKTDYKKIIETNLIGTMNLTFQFDDDMKKRGSGLIINIGSIQGFIASDWRNYEEEFRKPGAYNASKAALMALTRSFASEYGKYNIRSVCTAYAAVDTGKFKEPFKSKFLYCLPLKRFISIESCQRTLIYACLCPELTGQAILVDSGYTCW